MRVGRRPGSQVLRRRARVAALVSLALGVVAMTSGGCASSSSTTWTIVTAPQTPTATAPPNPASRFIYGQIVAENGLVWTVQGIRGNSYTVRVSDHTLFGSLFHQLHREQFQVGDNVRVAGIFAGTAVTATSVDFTNRVAPPTVAPPIDTLLESRSVGQPQTEEIRPTAGAPVSPAPQAPN